MSDQGAGLGPQLAQLMPFAARLGVEVTAATAEEVRGRLAWADDLCTSGGVMHGGALVSLADTLGPSAPS